MLFSQYNIIAVLVHSRSQLGTCIACQSNILELWESENLRCQWSKKNTVLSNITGRFSIVKRNVTIFNHACPLSRHVVFLFTATCADTERKIKQLVDAEIVPARVPLKLGKLLSPSKAKKTTKANPKGPKGAKGTKSAKAKAKSPKVLKKPSTHSKPKTRK